MECRLSSAGCSVEEPWPLFTQEALSPNASKFVLIFSFYF